MLTSGREFKTRQNSKLVQIEAIAEDNINVANIMGTNLSMGRKPCRKTGKYWLPATSS